MVYFDLLSGACLDKGTLPRTCDAHDSNLHVANSSREGLVNNQEGAILELGEDWNS